MKNKKIISSFRGEHGFLSNFYSAQVIVDGITYQNAEAAFQAQKTTDRSLQEKFSNLDARAAKRFGRRIQLRPDWNDYRLDAMKLVVKNKFFQNPDLKEQLLSTGDAVLVEGNDWNDRFWGVDIYTMEGQNHLGNILMDIRNEFAEYEREQAGKEENGEPDAMADCENCNAIFCPKNKNGIFGMTFESTEKVTAVQYICEAYDIGNAKELIATIVNYIKNIAKDENGAVNETRMRELVQTLFAVEKEDARHFMYDMETDEIYVQSVRSVPVPLGGMIAIIPHFD